MKSDTLLRWCAEIRCEISLSSDLYQTNLRYLVRTDLDGRDWLGSNSSPTRIKTSTWVMATVCRVCNKTVVSFCGCLILFQKKLIRRCLARFSPNQFYPMMDRGWIAKTRPGRCSHFICYLKLSKKVLCIDRTTDSHKKARRHISQ